MPLQELKPMDLGKLLDKTFRIVISGLPKFLIMFLIFIGIVFGVVVIFSLVFGLTFAGSIGFDFEYLSDNQFDNPLTGGILSVVLIVVFAILFLGFGVGVTFFYGMSYDLFIRIFLNIHWDFKSSFVYVRKRFWTIVLGSLLAFLLLAAGSLACGIGIIFVLPLVSIVIPIIMYEERSGSRSINRSFELVKPSYWPVLGTILLFRLIIAGLNFIFQIVFQGVTMLGSKLTGDLISSSGMNFIIAIGVILFFILYFAYSIFLIAIEIALFTTLFFNQKIKHENFGVELLTQSMISQNRVSTDHQQLQLKPDPDKNNQGGPAT